MVRKMSLLFAGALMGASAMSLVYGAPGSTAIAAGSETYKQLAIFGDIFVLLGRTDPCRLRPALASYPGGSLCSAGFGWRLERRIPLSG